MTYEATKTEGTCFRNTEILSFDGDRDGRYVFRLEPRPSGGAWARAEGSGGTGATFQGGTGSQKGAPEMVNALAPDAQLQAGPRTFASAREALEALAGVAWRSRSLVSAYLGGGLDRELRERVMVAVSRANACRGCTVVHERWAIRAGVSGAELEAIGLGDLAVLDDRNRAALLYATARARARFRGPVPAEVDAAARERLTEPELAALEAVARAISLANLSLSTISALRDRLR